MTVSSGFFDSVNHDRLYNADQVSSMFDGLILDGVYENMGEAFAINAYPDAENTVIVGTGRAWFDHTWTLNDTQYALTLDPPSDSMSRIDAIVLDVDKTLEVRNNTIKLIKGTPVFTGGDPQKPTLVKEDLHNQYPLAYVTRSAGASATINQADIEYMVGTDECPMVIGLLEAINIEQVYAQLKDEFYLWWDGVILGDPDMATHLQEQIDELKKNNYSGLLTYAVNQLFQSGKYDFDVKSFDIDKDADIRFSATNYSNNYNVYDNPLSSVFLIGGNGPYAVCRLKVKNPTSSNDNNMYAPVIISDFYTIDGVKTEIKTNVNNKMGSENYSFINLYILNYDVDTNPYTFDIMLSWYDMNNDRVMVTTHRLTITQDLVSSIEDLSSSDKLAVTGPSSLNQGVGISSNLITNKTGNYTIIIISNVNNSASGVRLYRWEITPSYVISNPLWGASITKTSDKYDPQYVYYDLTDYANLCFYNDETGEIIIPGVQSEGTILADWQIVFDSSGSSATLIPQKFSNTDKVYKVKYPYSTLTLGEETGIVSTSFVEGTYKDKKETRINNYFVGGNNSGDSIPEGSYIYNTLDDGTMVGIVGNKQVAIGTNGGCAVLNKTVNISGSFDSNNVIMWYPSSVTHGGKTLIALDGNSRKNWYLCQNVEDYQVGITNTAYAQIYVLG